MSGAGIKPLIVIAALCVLSFASAILLASLPGIRPAADLIPKGDTPVTIAFGIALGMFAIILGLTIRHIFAQASRRAGHKKGKSAAAGKTEADSKEPTVSRIRIFEDREGENSSAAAAHLLSDIFRAAPYSIMILSADSTVRVGYKCEAFSPEDPSERKISEVIPAEMINPIKLRKTVEAALSGQTRHLDNLVINRGRRRISYDLTAAPLGSGETAYGAILLLKDVSGRWELNRKLVESRDFLRDIIYRSPAGVCVFSRDGKAIMVNDAYLKLFRLERAAIVNRYSIFEETAYKERGLFPEIQRAFAGNVVSLPPTLFSLANADHTIAQGREEITAQGVLFPLFGPGGSVSNVILMHNDLTDLTHAQREVDFLSEYNKRILDSMGAGVQVIDEHLKIKYRNDFMREILPGASGAERCCDFLGMESPCEECAVLQAINTGEVVHREYTGADGRIFNYVAAPLAERDGERCAVSVIRDITDGRRMEQQMAQQEKLSTLGILAGGIAHQINNPLGVISMYAQMLSDDIDNPEEARRHVEVINRNIDNCRKIIQGLLTFARKQPAHKETTNINECVREAAAMCLHLMEKSGIELAEELDERELLISGDPVQLQQVFLNLITNAAHSMPDGGALTVTTGKRIEQTGEKNIYVKISDTGTGMPGEVLDNAFEPFFTTKKPGEGTGLGLAVSRSIVETHGGTIAGQSAEGAGSTFTVVLPCVQQDEAASQDTEAATRKQ